MTNRELDRCLDLLATASAEYQQPTRYPSDLIRDAQIIVRRRPANFVWVLRTAGSHYVPIDYGPEPLEAVLGAFEDIVELFLYARGDERPPAVGGSLDPITIDDALLLLAETNCRR